MVYIMIINIVGDFKVANVPRVFVIYNIFMLDIIKGVMTLIMLLSISNLFYITRILLFSDHTW